MSDAIAGRVVLVTGAAHRIGRAIARDLAAQGAHVVAHANRSAEAAVTLADEMRALHGVRTAVVTGDLADAGDVARILPDAVAALGRVDVLINNASVFEADDARDVTSASWRRHMAINAEAPALLTRALAADVAARGGTGLVVNIIDQRVWKPTPAFLSYSASKAALWWTTRTMAQALAPTVRVNALAPGPILKSSQQSDEAFAALVDTLPLAHAPKAAAFGQAICFLHAMPSVTGQMIALDAGQHLAWRTPDALVPE